MTTHSGDTLLETHIEHVTTEVDARIYTINSLTLLWYLVELPLFPGNMSILIRTWQLRLSVVMQGLVSILEDI